MIKKRKKFVAYLMKLQQAKKANTERVTAIAAERKEIKLQIKQASTYKFGKMTRAKAFLPSLSARGEFQTDYQQSISSGTLY